MPNRILKESICTSDSIDSLTEFQEIFFYRLITACDDFGRMDARPRILAARLFPLKEDLETWKITDALEAMKKAGIIILYQVDGKPYLQMVSWDKHQQIRAKKSKYPSFADGLGLDERISNQMISSDIKCPRNPIQSESNPNPESESESKALMDDAEARAIQSDHDTVLNAAENAGFPHSPIVNQMIIQLYAEYGLEKLLDGITECASHSANSVAYLKAVLKGGPKKPKARVAAQDFVQRDYSGVQDELNDALAREIEEMKRQEAMQ